MVEGSSRHTGAKESSSRFSVGCTTIRAVERDLLNAVGRRVDQVFDMDNGH